MKLLGTLAKQKPHRILTSVMYVVTGFSLCCIVAALDGRLYGELKRYKASGRLLPYLSVAFSDPLILPALIVSVFLFGLNIVVTLCALKNGEYAAPLHVIGLALSMLVFFGLIGKILFAS